MGYFINKPLVEVVAIVFMLLSGLNFALHFVAWRSMSVRHYFTDSEAKTYFAILFLVASTCVGYLFYTQTFEDVGDTVIHAVFQAVSIGTTTGFTTHEYHTWPGFLPVLLLFTSFIGACAGSTGGGMKVIRFLLLTKQGIREIIRVIHPSAVVPIRIGDKPLSDRVIDSVWGFFSAYVGAFVLMLLGLMFTGMDQVTAFSAVAACMNNLGPGLGEVGPHYADISVAAKWILCFAMLLGRLE